MDLDVFSLSFRCPFFYYHPHASMTITEYCGLLCLPVGPAGYPFDLTLPISNRGILFGPIRAKTYCTRQAFLRKNRQSFVRLRL